DSSVANPVALATKVAWLLLTLCWWPLLAPERCCRRTVSSELVGVAKWKLSSGFSRTLITSPTCTVMADWSSPVPSLIAFPPEPAAQADAAGSRVAAARAMPTSAFGSRRVSLTHRSVILSDAMHFDADHETFRKTVRDFVGREIDPNIDGWEEAGIFPAHELFPKLGQAGLFGLEYDPEFGGQGADHSYTVILGEELGRAGCGGVPMAISVQSDMATPSLHRFGTDELKRRYLTPAIKGEMVASIAVTEPDAGSDVAGLRTRAVRDGDEWVINGSKLYITNGTQADWLCVLARTSDEGGSRGMSQIVVPSGTPGFSVSRKLNKLGNWSSDTAELSFVDARVPFANTIGVEGRG